MPMLYLHHSNRLEGLIDELAELLGKPSGAILEPETVVVQNQGMERWLMQQLAQRQGIAANINFPLPATFIWRIFESQLGDLPRNSVFDKASLLWRIMAALPDLLPLDDFKPLRRYLQGEDKGLMAYQLCSRVADLFDQYLVYRSEMILGWENAPSAHAQGDMFAAVPVEADGWQAQLWRAVVQGTDGKHRARLWDAFFAQKQMDASALPKRVTIFGLSGMAPNYVQVLARLAEAVDVHVFLLNPSREYWADIVDAKGQARRRAAWRRQGKQDVSGLLDVGNPLLASMGHVGQVFVDQLLELQVEESESFESPLASDATLLNALQADVLELLDRRTADEQQRPSIPVTDRSVQLHVCHSSMREVQVLHDQLLRLFADLDGLEPRDVVVMAPNIEAYAPYIEAVFESSEPSIPWSIADLSIAAQSPLLESLDTLLRLPDSRFAASELLSLLEVPAVARCFSIKADALPRIRQWVTESGIRWGLDGAMREDMGLPAEAANSWEAGLQSLFLGYAMPAGDDLFQAVYPYPHMEGNEVEDLGRLQAFVNRLSQWRKRLSGDAELADWRVQIGDLLDAFYAPDEDEERLLQAVREGLSDLADCAKRAAFSGEVGLTVIRHHLDQVLADNSETRRFLAGGVTFCNMVPMRSIPFRVVCLLGLNDTDFPREQRPLGFDLMAKHPKHTDRSRRLDDRYLFLEALLSARDVFYLSYQGHDIRDNSSKVASVVVSELLEYIGLSFQAEHLTVRHPLQAFSSDYYRADQRPELFSYDAYWLAAAAAKQGEETAFASADLPAEATLRLDLNDLLRFLLHPSRWFLQRRLGVRYGDETELVDDLEPFMINFLDRYELRQAALRGQLAEPESGCSDEALQALTRAKGLLPHGILGELVYAQAIEDIDALSARIIPRIEQRLEAIEVNLQLDDTTLAGWLNQISRSGRTVYRASKLKPKDQISLWLHHLCLNAVETGDGPRQSAHIAEDQTLIFKPMSQDDARQALTELVGAFKVGQARPLKFYPATSLAYADGVAKDAAEGKITTAINKAWASDFGERHDLDIRTAQRGNEPLEEPFRLWAETLLLPMLAAAELIKAENDEVAH